MNLKRNCKRKYFSTCHSTIWLKCESTWLSLYLLHSPLQSNENDVFCVCFFSFQTWNLFEIENSKVKFIHIENACHKISVLLSTCGLHIYKRVLNSCWRCAKYKLDISKYEFGSFNSQNTARNHAYGFIYVQFIMHTSRGWTKITIINVNANANAILIMIYYEYDLDV